MRFNRFAASVAASAFLALAAFCGPANAQSPIATVVASCSSLTRPTPYPVSGTNGMPLQPLTIDQNGVLCTNATGGGGGASNITQVAGVDVTGMTAGSLPVSIVAGGGSGGTASGYGSAFPAQGTAIGLSDGTNMVAYRGDTTNGAWANIKTSVLPTGAATAAKQPALGTAGTASTDVITVQGIASMTPFLSNPGTAANWGVGATGSAVPANAGYNGINVGGNLRGATGLGLGSTFSQTVAIVDASGNQVTSFGGSGGTASNFGSAFPSTGTAIGVSDGTNMVSLKSSSYGVTPTGNALAVNAFVTNSNANGSATSANSSPVVIASDQAAVAVKNNGAQYETVAASQTAQVMGPTGATGDYLSHCVIYPTSVSPGVVTVFDNANAAATNAIAFPGGTSSLSNLAPIPIPVGAVSTAGAWKVTTGANVVVTCYGKFT